MAGLDAAERELEEAEQAVARREGDLAALHQAVRDEKERVEAAASQEVRRRVAKAVAAVGRLVGKDYPVWKVQLGSLAWAATTLDLSSPGPVLTGYRAHDRPRALPASNRDRKGTFDPHPSPNPESRPKRHPESLPLIPSSDFYSQPE